MYSSDGSTQTGTVTTFQNAYIFWCAATNAAWSIHGSIYDEYWNTLKGPNSVLGYPTSDEEPVYASDGTTQIGRQNTFQNGTIFFSNQTGAHELHGPILTKYLQLGGAAGGASFPITDVQPVYASDGLTQIGQKATFQGAPGVGTVTIYYSSATGAFEVQGTILSHYTSNALNGPAGLLGFPTNDEGPVYASDGVTQIGRVSTFQNGNIYYNGSAWEVHGPILTKYLQLSGPAGGAGFPSSDVQTISGGYLSTFQGAPGVGQVNIYSSSAGAYEVQGSILQKYLSVGGPGSALGFPTSDEHAAANGVDRESDFQHGYIIYSESSRQATVYYT